MPKSEAEVLRRRGYVKDCRERQKQAGKTREPEYSHTNMLQAVKRANMTSEESAAKDTVKRRRMRLDRLLKKHPNAKKMDVTPDKAAGLPAGAKISVPIEEAEQQLYPNGRRKKALFLNVVDEVHSGNQVPATHANMMGAVNATPSGSEVVGTSNLAQNEPCSTMNMADPGEWQFNNPNAQHGFATPFDEADYYLDENLSFYGLPPDANNNCNHCFDDDEHILQDL